MVQVRAEIRGTGGAELEIVGKVLVRDDTVAEASPMVRCVSRDIRKVESSYGDNSMEDVPRRDTVIVKNGGFRAGRVWPMGDVENAVQGKVK